MSYIDNHFLFSETYIKEYIKEKNKKKIENIDDIENLFRQIKQWNMEYVSGDYSNEPWSEYIDSVIDVLGFQKNKHNSFRLLYADIIKEGDKPVAICNLIDKSEELGTITKGKYHAFNTIREAKAQGVSWAMLTNGYKWRIYNLNKVSPYENYLEIDIEESIRNNIKADEAFKLFYLFFSVHTYYTENNQLNIENIKDSSDKKAEVIEETLRGKAEEILKELCYGLKEDMSRETYTEEEKRAIYNDAIILLYRLLFFGYAESRGLLPVLENDPEYTDSYKKLCEDAVEIYNAGELYKIKDKYDFWKRLDDHLRIYVDRSYNGGLFNNEDKPILKKHRIANGRLIKCLAELSYNIDKSNKYSAIIEYKDLSVRNLGSIYEGLLEYGLFIADERMVQRKNKGQVKFLKESEVKLQNSDLKNIIEKGGIYLSQGAAERKETGAYYTPEDVVEYIVNNTVGTKLKELKNELNENKKSLVEKLSYEPVESNKRILQRQIDEVTFNFINEKILTLSIIDSAMGSGHFLVNAAYKVANEILEIIAENDWESDGELNNVDIKYWKRKVVENCIYGIDINGLSVSLAKLSLWLISASNDKALSFIDHHLKEGNSIIGTDRNNVEMKNSDISIFGISYKEYMKSIISKYEKLNNIGSAAIEDVARQKKVFDEINDDLKIAKRKYDYYLAKQYLGEKINEITYSNLLRSNDINDFRKEEMNKLWKIADDKNFFHWELEFPEVFQKGGFDIAIGNPPYVEYKRNYFDSLDLMCKNIGNLYAPMIENNILNLKRDNGFFGFIVPIALVCTERMGTLQDVLKTHSENIYISNFAVRPGKIFKRAEMNISILFGESATNKDCSIYTTNYIRWKSNERKDLFKNIQFVESGKYCKNGIMPKLGEQIELDILDKLFKCNKKVKEYIDINGKAIYLHSGGRYWRKAILEQLSIKYKPYKFKGKYANLFNCLFNSNLFYWYWILFSDCYDLMNKDVVEFPINLENIEADQIDKFDELSYELMADYEINSLKKERNKDGKTFIEKSYYPKLSKNIIDKIDFEFANIYNFNQDEISYLINYEISFRMGETFGDGEW